MKTVSVQEAQTNLAELLRVVAAGEEIEVVQEEKRLARLIPVNDSPTSRAWLGHFSKLDALYGHEIPQGKPGSQIILEGRR